MNQMILNRVRRATGRVGQTGQKGITLIEVLVSLVILSIGLFGIMQLYAAGQRAEVASQQHSEALLLVNDMVSRINANRSAADCYPITDGSQFSDGSGYVGTGNDTEYRCVRGGGAKKAAKKVANSDLDEWGEQVKALVGGRGCIYDDGNSDSYRVVVVWQGRRTGDDPATNCGQGLYGGAENGESQRRAMSRTLRIADLD